MQLDQVLAVLTLLESASVEFCVDGGWGVDALLGYQTRPHEDLDLAIQRSDVEVVRQALGTMGYHEVVRADSCAENFVLRDSRGHEIDVHVYEFDAHGLLIYGIAYERDDLTGTGRIGDLTVRCIEASSMVRYHDGYELDEHDYHDVRLLCERFDIELPERFASMKAAIGDDPPHATSAVAAGSAASPSAKRGGPEE